MAKVSANYEVVYIIDPAQGEEGIAALVAKFKTLAEQNGSAVEVEEWGGRKLAYPINYKTEGYYVLMTFSSEPSFPRELDRVLRITDGIMRSLNALPCRALPPRCRLARFLLLPTPCRWRRWALAGCSRRSSGCWQTSF